MKRNTAYWLIFIGLIILQIALYKTLFSQSNSRQFPIISNQKSAASSEPQDATTVTATPTSSDEKKIPEIPEDEERPEHIQTGEKEQKETEREEKEENVVEENNKERYLKNGCLNQKYRDFMKDPIKIVGVYRGDMNPPRCEIPCKEGYFLFIFQLMI